MKRPLTVVALLYVAGILLAHLLPSPLLPLFGISFVLVFVCLIWPTMRLICLCALLVLMGWINLAQRTNILSPYDLRQNFTSEQIVTVRGVLSETPYHRAHKFKHFDVWSSMARMEVTAVRASGHDWEPAFGQIMTSTKELLTNNFFAGQTVEVKGVLEPTKGPLAEGLFDNRRYLQHQGIYHQLTINLAADWHILSAPARPLSDRFSDWARKCLALGLPVEDESLRLEWALTLGWKAGLTDEVADPFIKAATYHIFAVDGLRVAIVAGIVLAILRTTGIPRAYCGILMAIVLLFYAAMTGWPASAIRASIMITVVFGGWLLNRPGDLLNSLCAAALVILIWQPGQLFQAGFQLSFFVVVCIIMILPAFDRLAQRLLRLDPLRVEAFLPVWQKALRTGARYTLDLLFSSLAAWLGSIPLVALYFHLITPLSGPANLFAVPLCALVLICNLSSLLFAASMKPLAILFNYAGWFFMECIRVTSNWSAHWPGAYYYVPMPGLFTIALYYAILLAVLTGWLFREEWRFWKISGVTASVLIWCGLCLADRPVTRLTVLPLSGGHAVYIQDEKFWNDWLIDCGAEEDVQAVVKPFLQAQGVNRLSNFLLTHGEIRYTGGAEVITDLFRPRNIFTSQIHFRSPDYREFQEQERHHPAWRAPLLPGDSAGAWTVLYPPAQSRLTKAADNPLVLRGEINGTRVLLLSDLSHTGQNALLSGTNNLHADIVVAGLPDEGEPLSEQLLSAVQPKAIVIADCRVPANKKAGAKLKRRLASHNIPLLYTSVSDAVTLTLRPNRWELRAMDGTKISGLNANPR